MYDRPYTVSGRVDERDVGAHGELWHWGCLERVGRVSRSLRRCYSEGVDAISEEIRRAGPIPFARFMELALYHPEHGYYTRPRGEAPGPAGAEGDFLTAPTAEPLFAQTVAQLLTGLAERSRRALTLVEMGAGEGIFLERLFAALGPRRPEILRRVVAIDAGSWAQQRIAQRCGDVEVARALDDLARPDGPVLLFASELYDAIPAHRVTVVSEKGELVLREYHVDERDGRFVWVLREPSCAELASHLLEHGILLEEDQIAEVRPGVQAMHEGLLRWCGGDGLCLLIEYGYPARQLFNPRARRRGTLVGYRAHAIVEDVLDAPGSIDITAHVNLDDVSRAASRLGWSEVGRQPLGAFLALHGALDLLPTAGSEARALTPEEWAVLGGAKRLLSPAGMGSDLKVVVQGVGRIWHAYGELATLPPVDA